MEALPRPELERRLRLVAESADDHAFMLLDRAGTIQWWSRASEIMFGYSAGEILGRSVDELFVAADRAAGIPEYERTVSTVDGPAEDDRWMRRKDDSTFWASGIMVEIKDEGGQSLGYGKILRNRTDLKEQIETLRNLAVDLETAGKRKDAFLGVLSHELRNPMAPITNALAIIRANVPHVTRELGFAMNVIDRQVHLLGRLVEDLVDMTRASAGKIDLRLERLVLQDLARECIEDTSDLARQRRQHVELVATEGAIFVDGDRDRLHQVVVNLLVNAAKYTPEGGHAWVKVTTEADEALLKVGDDGVGIPTDMLPKIFDLFTQVESTRAQSRGGLGIGLALVKHLVALHGGSVQVRSDGTGKGSEFTIRLPLAAAGAKEKP